MRAFGLVLIIIGIMVIYLGWQGKVMPAFQALFGLPPSPLTGKDYSTNDPATTEWSTKNPTNGNLYNWGYTPEMKQH